MSDNLSAFPEGIAVSSAGDIYGGNDKGMTLRDYFEVQALVGLLSHYGDEDYLRKQTPLIAYTYADAMLKQREEE